MGGNGRKVVRTGASGPQRVRFSVPREDMVLWNWIEAQEHLSASLCFLMAEAARTCGSVDVIRSGFKGGSSKEIPTIPAWPYMSTEQQAVVYRQLREQLLADLSSHAVAPAAPQAAEQPRIAPVQQPERAQAPDPLARQPRQPRQGTLVDDLLGDGQAEARKKRNKSALDSLLV